MDRPEDGANHAIDAVARALAGRVRCERDVPAATLTTWRVGGPIALVVHATCVADVEALAAVLDPALGVLPIGRGSNLLLADAGFPGVGIVLEGELDAVQIPEASAPGQRGEARAGGGVALPVLARQLAAAGWAGLEFFVGIPGSVGGAVRMNAGGHGRETVEVLLQAQVVALDERRSEWRDVESLALSYRHSGLGARDVVVGATFGVTRDEPQECLARIDEVVRWRRAHQPGGANAGSVFRNPTGDSAGRLIDGAGLKGTRVGGAFVSEKHANFIQTEPGATAREVRELIELVRGRVADSSGVELQTEVRMIGFGPSGREAQPSGGGDHHPPTSGSGTRP